MTRRDKWLLRAYWLRGGGYARVRVRADDTVEAQRAIGTPWGVLETPKQARRSLEILRERAKARDALSSRRDAEQHTDDEAPTSQV